MTRFRMFVVALSALLFPLAALPAATAGGNVAALPTVVPNTSISGVPKVLTSTWTHQGAPLVGHTIELQVKESGQTDFTVEGSAVTDDAGVARVTATLTYHAQIRWRHLPNGPITESFSAIRTQNVKVRIGALLNDRSLRIGQNLVVTGRVLPAKPGRIVRLVRYNADGTVTPLASARLAADGRYRIVRSFAKKSAYTIAVQFPNTSRNLGNSTTWRHIRIGAGGA